METKNPPADTRACAHPSILGGLDAEQLALESELVQGIVESVEEA